MMDRAIGRWVLVAGLVAGSGVGQLDGQPPVPPAEAPVQTAVISGIEDSGVFHIYRDEERILRITFKLSKQGTYEGTAVVTLAGQTITLGDIKVTADAQGRWEKFENKTPRGLNTITRKGNEAEARFATKSQSLKLKPEARLWENYSPALISHVLRLYDKAKKGPQTFPLVLAPGAQLTGTLTWLDAVERTISGKDFTFSRYKYALPGVDVTVWADGEGKVYFVDVPAQRAAYLREGYESLRTPDDDPLLSQPKFEVVETKDVRVPMRDGMKLTTDLYRPKTEGKVPAILVRTPYKKEVSELTGKFYGRRGYAVAIQNCRGRFGSEGEWEPFVHERKDGYDAVEWLAAQPWCSGKVGMIGASYLGWTQWWAAVERPPHLVTIIPNVAPPDPFYNIPYEYGTFFLLGAIWWADVVESGATADISGATLARIREKGYGTLLRQLPVVELDKAVLGKENRSWRTWIEHPTHDDYWKRASFLDELKEVRLPVFHQSGWFDGDGIGSKLNYLRMASHGHGNQKLVLGPWGHTDVATRNIGDADFGPNAIRDLPRDYLRWFDFWLKGIDNGIMKEPLVSLFVMNTNQWLEGPSYPLPQTQFEKWYLDSAGNANTSKGDGRLSRELPKGAASDSYVYDPGDPTPRPEFPLDDASEEQPQAKPASDTKGDTKGERKSQAIAAPKGEAQTTTKSDSKPAPETNKPATTKPLSTDDEKAKRENRHEHITAKRHDILVYVSEPFNEPYTFAGPISAVLYASSSARDTDWFVRLIEVDPKGKLSTLCEGKIRARFRESMSQPVFLEPGKVYPFSLDLWQTGITMKKGSRLRVEVASASFPMFSRNLNTGGHNEKETTFVKATQTILHSAEYPSHLLLPKIPDFPKGK